MVKEKSLGVNPALAHHRKAKKDNARKAKQERDKVRDERLVQKRPERLEARAAELRKAKADGTIDLRDARYLEALERDLKRIEQLRVKGKIAAAPASTCPVVTSDRTQPAREKAKHEGNRRRQDGRDRRLPRDPTKSIYYDPVFNPYGAAPPGMPYREHGDAERQEARMKKQVTERLEPKTGVDEDAEESDASSTAYIPFPTGTPPPVDESDSDSASDEDELEKTEVPQKALDQARDPEPSATVPSLPPARAAPKTTYGAEPQIRDLRKEAASFVPSTLKRPRADRAERAYVGATQQPPASLPAPTQQRGKPENEAEEVEEVEMLPVSRPQRPIEIPQPATTPSANGRSTDGPEPPAKKTRRLNIAPR